MPSQCGHARRPAVAFGPCGAGPRAMCSCSTPPGASCPSSPGSRARCRCTSAGPPSTARRTWATAGSRSCSTSCGATWRGRATRSRTSPTSPTSTTRSSSAPGEEGRTGARSPRGARASGTGRWTRSTCSARPTIRTPPPTSTRWSSSSPARRHGVAYETTDGVYFQSSGSRTTAAGPPAARLAQGRRPGRGHRGEALADRLRPLEEGQAGRADRGPRRGARAGPDGTPSAW